LLTLMLTERDGDEVAIRLAADNPET